MTARTQPALLDQIASQLPDNTSRLITPAHVRGCLVDLADSLGNQVLDVRRFGAVPNDDTVDDTTAIQAALDLAFTTGTAVHMPAGTYKITSTLLYRGLGTLYGDGKLATCLRWHGATDGTVLQVSGVWNYALRDFNVTNGLGARGTTVGIRVERIEDVLGSVSGGANWTMIGVYDFDQGALLGNVARGQSTSEITLDHCSALNCRVGFHLSDWNTLNILFTMLEITMNEIGVRCAQAGSVHVLGGGSAANTVADFQFENGGIWSVAGFRSESTKRLATGVNTAGAARLSLRDCLAVAADPLVDDVLVELEGGMIARVTGCQFLGGHVKVGHPQVRLTMQDNAVRDTVLVESPADLPPGFTGSYRYSGNVRLHADGTLIEDFPEASGSWYP